MVKTITTSWDDGHPKDFQLAALLEKYNLKGTFYIPKTNPENEVMSETQISELSKFYEIGGHTLHHLRLTNQSPETIQSEITGCYHWLNDITKTQPVSFCFPLGAYNDDIIKFVKKAGFKIARTTELLSLSTPSPGFIIPTTIQVYDHQSVTYFGHLVKRLKFNNLFLWMKSLPSTDILKLADFYIEHIIKHGGCFHLWGHSWEIEKFGLWQKLELIFKHISNLPDFKYLFNKDLTIQ